MSDDPTCLMTHNVMSGPDIPTKYSLLFCHDEAAGKDISIDLDDPSVVFVRVNEEILATVHPDGTVTGDAEAALKAVAHAALIWRKSLEPVE